MKQSQFQAPNTPDISMSLIGIVVGIVVGIYITNLPLGIIFTAICVSLILIVFKNFEISNQPSIAIIIAFLLLPLLTILDPEGHDGARTHLFIGVVLDHRPQERARICG